MKKELTTFLIDLSNVYPIPSTRDEEKIIKNYTEYLLEFCYNKEMDWKKLKHFIFDNYKKSFFPEISFIRDSMPHGEVYHYKPIEEGGLIVLKLPNGYRYEFTITGTGQDLSSIKAKLNKKYGSGYSFKKYPKGTTIIGSKVFEEGKQEYIDDFLL